MKKTFGVFTLTVAAACGTAIAAGEHPGHGVHWGYSGDIGPDKWTTLKPEFAACAGRNQSPIDVARTIEAELLEDLLVDLG